MIENEDEVTKKRPIKRKSLIVTSKFKTILDKISENQNIEENIKNDINIQENIKTINNENNNKIKTTKKNKNEKRKKSKNLNKKYQPYSKNNLVIKLNKEMDAETDELFSNLVNNNKSINKCINRYDNPNSIIILNKQKNKKKYLEMVEEAMPLDVADEPNVYNINIYYEGKLFTCSFNKKEKLHKLKEKIREKISPFYKLENFDILYKLKKIDFNANLNKKFEDIFDIDLKEQNIILKKKQNLSTDKMIYEKNQNNNIVIIENFPSFNDLSNELNTFFNKDNNYFSFQIQYNRNFCKIFLNNAEKAFSLVSYLNDLKFSNPIFKRLKINLDYKLTLRNTKKKPNIILPLINIKNNIIKEVNDSDTNTSENNIIESEEDVEEFVSLVNKNCLNSQKNNNILKANNFFKINEIKNNKGILKNKSTKYPIFRVNTERNDKSRNYLNLFQNYKIATEANKPVSIKENSYSNNLLKNSIKSYNGNTINNKNYSNYDKKETSEDINDSIKPEKKEFKRKYFLYPKLDNSKKSPYLKAQKKLFTAENLQNRGKKTSYFFGFGNFV